MPTRLINLWRWHRALNGHPVEHHAVGVKRFEAQGVAIDGDFGAMVHTPKLRVRRVALYERIEQGAASARYDRVDAVHRSKTLKIVVVTVQDQLHAMLPRDGQKQALESKAVIDAVVRLEAVQPAVVDRDVEEKAFPRLGCRGEVVGQPAVLGGAITQVIFR